MYKLESDFIILFNSVAVNLGRWRKVVDVKIVSTDLETEFLFAFLFICGFSFGKRQCYKFDCFALLFPQIQTVISALKHCNESWKFGFHAEFFILFWHKSLQSFSFGHYQRTANYARGDIFLVSKIKQPEIYDNDDYNLYTSAAQN